MKTNAATILILINLILIIVLSGCIPAADSVHNPPLASTLNSEIVMSSPIVPTITPMKAVENTLVGTATAVPTTTPTPTLIATSTPLVTISSSSTSKICAIDPQKFAVTEVLDINRYVHLSFQGENTILFDGWAPRPAPHNAQENSVQVTPGPAAGPGVPSARVLFKAGQIDLESNSLLSRTFDIDLSLNHLADILGTYSDEQWPLEQITDRLDVLGQSPDEQWQLVQVSDWSEDANGIWLLSPMEALRIVPYVPPNSTWDWADDSSILWYVHHTPEFGADSIIVHLEQPPLVNRSQRDPENFLDATYYRLAFSPVTKTVLSTGDSSELGIVTDEILIMDATNTDLQSRLIIPGAISAVWNQATKSYIIMVENDESTDFMDLDGKLLVRVPDVLPPFVFALSPSGQRLAIGYGSAGIWVYECSD